MLSFGVGPGDIWWKTEHSYYVIVTDESGLSSDRFSISLLENDPKTFTHKMVESLQIERWTVSQLAKLVGGMSAIKSSTALLQFSKFTLPPFHQKHAHVPAAHSYYLMFPASKWRKLRFLANLLKLYSNALRHNKSQSPWTLESDRERNTAPKKHVWVVGPNMNINTGRHKHSTDPSAFDSVLNVVSPTQHAGHITNNKSLGHCKREIAVWFPTLQKLRAAAGGAGACAKGGCMSLPNAARNRGT